MPSWRYLLLVSGSYLNMRVLFAGSNIYCAENFTWWRGIGIHMRYSRAILCCSWDSVKHDYCTCWTAFCSAVKAHHQVLSSFVWKSKVGQQCGLVTQLSSVRFVHTYTNDYHHFCRACEALKNCMPEMLKDGTFSNCLLVGVTIPHFEVKILYFDWLMNDHNVVFSRKM